MKKRLASNTTLISLLLLFTSTFAWADLNATFQAELSLSKNKGHIASLKNQFSNTLSKKHVVYVSGFLHEVLPFQFIKNKEALKELGVQAFTEIYPSSHQSASENARVLSETMLGLFSKGNNKGEGKGLPIIIIAHSKGAAESLLMAIQYPGLVTSGIIEKVVTIQAGISTPLAELADIGQQVCGPKLSPCGFVRNVFKDGLESLREKNSSLMFSQSIKNLQQSGHFHAVSKAIFYVRSSQTVVTGLAPSLVGTYKYLNKFGQNDGVINVEKQKLDGLGNDLGIISADHADLVMHSNILVYGDILWDAHRTRYIKSFTRALIKSLYPL